MLVNAAGPWVDQVLAGAFGRNNVHNVRLVQGSHIIVRKKFTDPRAYFFQNPDNRIIFAIPYEGEFTLIGTTDRDYTEDPKDVRISPEEVSYLCDAASEYFQEPVRPDDIVWSYSAVRPLFDDGASKAQEATRDYVLKVEGTTGDAPLLNVFGGKLTTYRRWPNTRSKRSVKRSAKRARPGPQAVACRAAISLRRPSTDGCGSPEGLSLPGAWPRRAVDPLLWH